MNGKYASVRDSALDYLVKEGWAYQSNGNVEAPTGWFARVCNDISDAETLADLLSGISEFAYNDKLLLEQLVNSLYGNWLVMEDSNGFVTVIEFAEENMLKHAYSELETAFEAWDNQDDEVNS